MQIIINAVSLLVLGKAGKRKIEMFTHVVLQ